MDETIGLLLALIPALPLAAAILVGVLGARILKGYSHWIVILALLGSFAASAFLFHEVRAAKDSVDLTAAGPGYEYVVTLWDWAIVEDAYALAAPSGAASDISQLRDFRIGVSLRADTLTVMMLMMVTLVSSLVAIFAAGYMHGDGGYWRFFAYIALFVFSMTMLVSVSNFLLLFVFWEAVGVCSYLLIGFWYQKPEAAAAGKKAFLVNRVGDFGFALAIFLIWTTYGSLNFHDSLRNGTTDSGKVAESVLATSTGGELIEGEEVVLGVLGPWRIAGNDYAGGGIAFAICALLLLGACGKSAQFPLHVWLPDAMEGPTPVSALIHAATMVTAGVYMIARCTPLFMASPEAQLLVASVGAVTALLAALIALTQYDLKRVLAYSTVSQLGFMFMGLGAGTFLGITAAMFHLFTHAFFKALLFLGSGSVMHAMGHIIDMRRFGGLRHVMPITHWTFLIGCLALAGFPGFSGFWSKDGIVAAVHDRAHELHHFGEHGGSEDAVHGNGHTGNGHTGNGHTGNGHTGNGHTGNGHTGDGHTGDGHTGDGHTGDTTAGLVPVLFESPFSLERAARFATAYDWIYYIALLTAFLTAFYTFRAFYLTFYGQKKIPHEAGDHAHESPRSMTIPLIVLAIFAAGVGIALDRTWTASPNHYFSDFLGASPSLAAGAVAETRHEFEFHLTVAATSGVIALAAILIATYLYLGSHIEIEWIRSKLNFEGFSRALDGESIARLGRWKWIRMFHQGASQVGLGWLSRGIGELCTLFLLVLATPFLLGNFLTPYRLSQNKFYLDELYELSVVYPLRALAALSYVIDRYVVDAVVNLLGRIPMSVGSLMRSLQMGLVQFYAIAMVLGSLVLIAARILWAS